MRIGLVRELPPACKLTHKSDSEPPKDWKEALDRINGSGYLVKINSRGSINGDEMWQVQVLDGNKDLYRWSVRQYQSEGGFEAGIMEIYRQFHTGDMSTLVITEKGFDVLGSHLMGSCKCEDPLKVDERWGEMWQCTNDLAFHDNVAHAIEGRLAAAKAAMKVKGRKVAPVEA